MTFEYMPAYTISNENQRWATGTVPNVKKVLTVAGSGDQALFYKLSGAQIVDTFDMTYNAYVIQDIKCAAIKNLGLDDYKDLLVKLHTAFGPKIMLIPQMQVLERFLTPKSREIIQQNMFICSFGSNIASCSENLPTQAEYAKLQSMLKEPFTFIQSDIAEIGTKLQYKYDLINISNIFDYLNDINIQAKVLNSLSEHLNKNGRIACLPQNPRCVFNLETLASQGKDLLKDLEYEKKVSDNQHTKMILLQKTR